MTASKRILFVANFDRKNLYRRYYNHESKLALGFIRAGHHVLTFSDRDHAREATVFNTQKLGAKKMAQRLLETVQHYKPDLILFGHTDLLTANFYAELQGLKTGARLATFCVDALFRDNARNNFVGRMRYMDAGFITSWHKQKLQALNTPQDSVYFLPNPVDVSIETADVSQKPRLDFDFDGQFLGTGTGARELQLTVLADSLPPEYRFRAGGLAFGSVRMESTDFLQALTHAAVCPNIPIDDRDLAQIDPLYSSDRIAQTVGQGVATLVMAESKLSEIYEDGVVEYTSREDLVAQMVALRADDARRMKTATLGRRLAFERTNSTLVANYMVAAAFETPMPDVCWETTPV